MLALLFSLSLTAQSIDPIVENTPENRRAHTRHAEHAVRHRLEHEGLHVCGDGDARRRGEALPLGMTNTNTSVREFGPDQEVATPHAKANDVLVPVKSMDNGALGAAGAINSSVADLTKWMGCAALAADRFQLRLPRPLVQACSVSRSSVWTARGEYNSRTMRPIVILSSAVAVHALIERKMSPTARRSTSSGP